MQSMYEPELFGDARSASIGSAIYIIFYAILRALIQFLYLDTVIFSAYILYDLSIKKMRKSIFHLFYIQLIVFTWIMIFNYNKMINFYNEQGVGYYMDMQYDNVLPSRDFGIVDPNSSALLGFIKYTYLLPIKMWTRSDLIGKQGDYGIDRYQGDVNIKFYICFVLFVMYLIVFKDKWSSRRKTDSNGAI